MESYFLGDGLYVVWSGVDLGKISKLEDKHSFTNWQKDTTLRHFKTGQRNDLYYGFITSSTHFAFSVTFPAWQEPLVGQMGAETGTCQAVHRISSHIWDQGPILMYI